MLKCGLFHVSNLIYVNKWSQICSLLNKATQRGKQAIFNPQMYKNRQHPTEVECRLFCCPILLGRCRFCSFLKLLSYRHTAKAVLFFAEKSLAEFYPQGVRGIRKAAKLPTAAQVPRTARNQFKSVFRRDMCALQRGFSCPLRGNSPSGRKHFARSGKRWSAVCDGNSKPFSRKRHDWRARKGAGIVMPRRWRRNLRLRSFRVCGRLGSR